MHLLWMVFALTGSSCWGWHFRADDKFLASARKEIAAFHRLLHPEASVAASNHVHKVSEQSKDGSQGGGSASAGGGNSSEGEKSVKGQSIKHDHESGNKGTSHKEQLNKEYKQEGGKKGESHSGDSHGGHHHKDSGGHHGAGFKDRLSYKKGNYAKGYRDKYHLDELKKHDKFWSNKHSHDKYTTFGKHGSHHHIEKKGSFTVGSHKEGADATHQGMRGEHAKKQHHSDHKGHKSDAGKESSYKHNTEYAHKHASSNKQP